MGPSHAWAGLVTAFFLGIHFGWKVMSASASLPQHPRRTTMLATSPVILLSLHLPGKGWLRVADYDYMVV